MVCHPEVHVLVVLWIGLVMWDVAYVWLCFLQENEDLLAATIKHEYKLPAVVAKLQGHQLRPAKPSNVDVPLLTSLAQALPELDDDHELPMLRM